MEKRRSRGTVVGIEVRDASESAVLVDFADEEPLLGEAFAVVPLDVGERMVVARDLQGGRVELRQAGVRTREHAVDVEVPADHPVSTDRAVAGAQSA